MKRAFMRLIWICFVVTLLHTVCMAHPGGTDSNGGHTDRSTGEYHYHHGYSAHQHYDMDGDGDLDCAYDFDDRSGYNSGGSASGGYGVTKLSYSDGYDDGYDDGFIDGRTEGYADGKKDGDSRYIEGVKKGYADGEEDKERELTAYYERVIRRTVTGAVCIALAILVCTVVLIVRNYKGEIERIERKAKTEKETLRENHAQELAKLLDVSDKSLQVPEDVHLQIDVTPVKGKVSARTPFGAYTVYVSANGKRYHKSYGCSSATKPLHLFNVPRGFEPCQICCGKGFENTIPQWYKALTREKPAVRKEANTAPATSIVSRGLIRRPAAKQFSSFIDDYWYQGECLFVRMKTGECYCYYDVPENVFEAMTKTESVGHFYRTNIVNMYLCRMER